MKNLVVLLTAMVLCGGIHAGHAADFRAETGANFDWWADSKEGNARQFFVPLRLRGAFDDFSVTLLTAYADTHYDINGLESTSLGHMLDTKLITSTNHRQTTGRYYWWASI